MSKIHATSCLAFALCLAVPSFAAHTSHYQSIIPTTTLTAETSNNTSAADSFPGCEITTVTNGQCVDNGDLKASNISKVEERRIRGQSGRDQGWFRACAA